MNLLLLVEDVDGAVRYVLLDREVRLGSTDEGDVPLRGLERTVAVIEPSPDGPCLEPRGLVTILVNDRPPIIGQPLVAGDRLILGPAIARIVEVIGPCVRGEGARGATIAEPSGDGGSSLLLGLVEILDGRSRVDRIDRALALALESTGAGRAALVIRDIDGRAVSHRSRSTGLGGDLVLPEDLLRESEPVLATVGGDERTLLTAPIRGARSPAGWLVLEWSRASDADGSVAATMAIGAALGAALRSVRRMRIDGTTDRLAMIGRVMAGVAHDLKNLMSGLRTGVFYLDDILTTHDESRAREAWSILKGAQASIQALVSDMVAYSKQESPDLETADLAAVVRKAVDLTKNRAESRRIRLEADLEPAPLRIDPQAIERCVVNLLVNAIDAAPASCGSVRVSLADEGDASVLRVADDGPGIPDAIRERVFDLLYSTKGVRGTGFGLAITREIVEAHGGTVVLEPGGPGATFAVRLPRL